MQVFGYRRVGIGGLVVVVDHDPRRVVFVYVCPLFVMLAIFLIVWKTKMHFKSKKSKYISEILEPARKNTRAPFQDIKNGMRFKGEENTF